MGGLQHGEQSYNDDSARSYSVMILTAMGISMVVPEFIPEADWKAYSMFTIGAMLVLYAVFLRMQVGPHSYFFSYSYPEKKQRGGEGHGHGADESQVNVAWSIGVLVFGVIVIGVLAEVMSLAMDVGLEGTGAPPVPVSYTHLTLPTTPYV